jgi:hypothetical protein
MLFYLQLNRKYFSGENAVDYRAITAFPGEFRDRLPKLLWSRESHGRNSGRVSLPIHLRT